MSCQFWVSLIGRLAVCHRQLRRQLSVTTVSAGLNDTEFLLLCGCQSVHARQWSQQELAASIGLSASQASGVFESLRTKGLLAITPCPRDRRRQLWQITSEGQQRVQLIFERLAPTIAQWESCSSSADQQLVLTLLQRLGTCQIDEPWRGSQEAA